jgi:UDP-N-acetylmuramoylalanine--D-glutamate ligase
MDQKVVILGAGESGTGAAVLAKKQGFDTFVSDSGKIKTYYKEILFNYEVDWEEEKHTERLILGADEIIKSPGISEKSEIVQLIRKKNIRVISEIEFAGRFTDAKKVCITGSNGKTTTTSLLHHMMKKAGLNVGLAGNIGKSFAMSVAEDYYDYYVLEISSFQLDGMFEFKPDIAILLNITPDHLDRYDYNLQKYIDSKFKLTQNLSEDEYFIYCSDDEITIRELEKIVLRAKQLGFTLKNRKQQGAYLRNNMINFDVEEDHFEVSVADLSLKGKHNIYNSMAAGLAGSVLHIRKDNIRNSLMDFKGVEHRMERVTKVHGLEFINDSKATNVNSTWYALECLTGPVIWIAGGIDKGNDYSELDKLVKEKVKAIICLGLDNSKIHKAFEKTVSNIIEVKSMQEAVQTAYFIGKDGDTVLLSPACASFDLFENYEDRGWQFKKFVKEL